MKRKIEGKAMSNAGQSRWRQRLENFGKALAQLETACRKDSYSDLERAGLVELFELTFELAWKTLQDLLFYEGLAVNAPREVIRKALGVRYLDEPETETLLDALDKRDLLSHTYEQRTAEEAEELIRSHYTPALRKLCDRLRNKPAP
jgi:nucleotidyltransferase substrate binding protein (TIGR01987 family)